MKSTASLVLAFALVPFLAACGRSDPEQRPAATPAGPLVSTVTPGAATLEKLAAADALDGTMDHVISRCASCGLRMAGKPEFACRIGEYTLHSCAERCSHAVCDDPDAIFEDVEFPEK
jgi:hypothetical protein